MFKQALFMSWCKSIIIRFIIETKLYMFNIGFIRRWGLRFIPLVNKRKKRWYLQSFNKNSCESLISELLNSIAVADSTILRWKEFGCRRLIRYYAVFKPPGGHLQWPVWCVGLVKIVESQLGLFQINKSEKLEKVQNNKI